MSINITGSHSLDAIKLLPCPYCAALTLEMVWEKCEPCTEDDTDRLWWAECAYCGACGPRSDTEPQAIERWNTRATLFKRPLWKEHSKNPLGQVDEDGEIIEP